MFLSRYTNPKLTGVIVKEAVKCGRKDCRCSSGKLHKWYYYLYYRSFENGVWKLKKEYISRNKVKYLRAKIKEMKSNYKATQARLSANMSFLNDTFGFTNGKMSAEDLLKSAYEIS